MVRRTMVTLVAIATALCLSDFAIASPSQIHAPIGAPHLRTFSGEGISFSYPSSWHVYRFPWASSFSLSLAYLSNVRLHRPCVGQPISPQCQGPVFTLRANSALVIWTDNGNPGWRFRRERGTLLHIHGRPARLRVLKPELAWCPRNSSRMLDVIIARPEAPSDWYEFRACLTGPQLRQVQATVMAVLYSFHAQQHTF